MKSKNYRHYGSPERLKWLKEEMDFIGRYSEIKDGILTVFAIDPKHGKKKEKNEGRNKRTEKFQRRDSKPEN